MKWCALSHQATRHTPALMRTDCVVRTGIGQAHSTGTTLDGTPISSPSSVSEFRGQRPSRDPPRTLQGEMGSSCDGTLANQRRSLRACKWANATDPGLPVLEVGTMDDSSSFGCRPVRPSLTLFVRFGTRSFFFDNTALPFALRLAALPCAWLPR